MKTIMKKNILWALAVLVLVFPIDLSGQTVKGNKKVVKQEREIPEFNSIEVGGAFNVYFTQQEKISLVVEADENLLENIQTRVSGSVLKIESKRIKNATELNIYLSGPYLESVDAGGASSVYSESLIQSDVLTVYASGASQVKLNVEVVELRTKASGASYVKFTGVAGEHIVDASGAADVKAVGLTTTTTIAESSGASNVNINATEEVTSSSSGAGNISVSGNPRIITSGKSVYYEKDYARTNVESWQDGDTTTVRVGGVVVEVIDGDSTKVAVGNHSLVVDDDGNVTWKRNRKQKYNGHWAGFEMGVNGYVTNDFKIDVPVEYDFLTLKYEKSINVNINFFEQNINIANNKFGFTTGLGLSWNNYRFSNNVILVSDSAEIYGFRDYSRDWEKSKLVVNYLTLPLLFEYQTNRFSRSNSFHVTAGVIIGWRYATHTKMLYFDDGRVKPKEWDSFHIKPFRYDATFRIGWGVINLYANYSMNTLFKDGRGPELYPFTVGITFLSF